MTAAYRSVLAFGLAAVLSGILAAACHHPDMMPSRRQPAVMGGGAERGCLTGGCHRAVLAGRRLHRPVVDEHCEICHVSRSGGHPDGEGPEFFHILGVRRGFCFDCHLRSDPPPKFSHKPYAVGMCHDCHENHGSDIAPLLKRDVEGLCLYCHRDLAARLEGVRYLHAPLEEETCVLTCHVPHESDVRSLLREAPERLCLRCHDMPDTCAAEAAKPGRVPEGRGCAFCHYPHGGNRRDLLKGH